MLMNLGDVSATTVPKLAMVAAPREGGDLCTRMFIPHQCHDAIGVLAAVSVATAALLPDTPANELLERHADDSVVLEHPTGTFAAAVDVRIDDGCADRRAGRHRPHGAQADGRPRVPAGVRMSATTIPGPHPDPHPPTTFDVAAGRVRCALPHLRPG